MSKPTEGLNVTMITVIGLLSFILLFVIVIGTQAWYYVMLERENQRKVIDQAYMPLVKMQEEQKNELVMEKNRDGGSTMPIDQAMEQVILRVREERGGQR